MYPALLGYDITSTVLSSEAEWSIENAFNSSFVMPDVVLVRKVKGTASSELSPGETNAAIGNDESKKKGKAKSSASRKRERRMKKEEQKQLKLAAAAARMGLDTDKDVHLDIDEFEDGEAISDIVVQREKAKLEEQIKMDADLADDLEQVERELALGMSRLSTQEGDNKEAIGDEES